MQGTIDVLSKAKVRYQTSGENRTKLQTQEVFQCYYKLLMQ